MLGKFVNMAELSHQMGLEATQMGLPGAALAKGRRRALAREKTSGNGSKSVRNEGDARTEAASDRQRSGPRLDRRAELVKLAQPLLDQGMPVAEIHTVMEEFVQRKEWGFLSPATFEGIIESAIDALVDAEMQAAAAEEAGRLALGPDELQEVSLVGLTPEPLRWLWPGKIPLGRVTVIYGEAGLGKTCLALDLAARVSAGTALLDGTTGPEAGQVVIVNGEDPLVDEIGRRLAGGGANLQNIITIAGMKATAPPSSPHGSPQTSPAAVAGERSFDLGRDLPVLRQRIAAAGRVRLVIIDPLEAYCGKAGLNRARLRAVMTELGKLAAETGAAVVVISSSTKCDLPVKNLWRVDCDVLDDAVRYWVPVRFNYGPLPAGLAFRVTAAGLHWETQSLGAAADRGRGASAKQERCVQLREHADWLRQCLATGPCSAEQVLKSAAAAGLSVSQVKRAKQALGVQCRKEPVPQGRWFWEMPGQPEQPAQVNVHLIKGIKEVKEFSPDSKVERVLEAV